MTSTIDWDQTAESVGEGRISMERIQEFRRNGIELLPSEVLEKYREAPPTLNFLLCYGDDVIENDYKGIVFWGIVRSPSSSCTEDVLEVLSAWRSRMEATVSDAFEKELLSQVKEEGVDLVTMENMIDRFREIKHDLIHIELNNLSFVFGDPQSRQFYQGDFKDWLMSNYDFEDRRGDPSLEFVVLRSWLKSFEMSKYADHAGRKLGEGRLKHLLSWLWKMKYVDPDRFRFEKPALLFELLENAKLEGSQLVETWEPDRVGTSLILNSHYQFTVWREILELLSEGAQQPNKKGQYALHVLLAKGLPGQDILFAANEKVVKEVCPLEKMPPFVLAARERHYDTAVAKNEALAKSLKREQLSQIFSLTREVPQLLLGRHNLEPDEAYSKKVKECFDEGRRLEREKRKIDEMLMKHEKDSERLANKRRDTEKMQKWTAAD